MFQVASRPGTASALPPADFLKVLCNESAQRLAAVPVLPVLPRNTERRHGSHVGHAPCRACARCQRCARCQAASPPETSSARHAAPGRVPQPQPHPHVAGRRRLGDHRPPTVGLSACRRSRVPPGNRSLNRHHLLWRGRAFRRAPWSSDCWRSGRRRRVGQRHPHVHLAPEARGCAYGLRLRAPGREPQGFVQPNRSRVAFRDREAEQPQLRA